MPRTSKVRFFSSVLAASLVSFSQPGEVQADLFELKDGRVLNGSLVSKRSFDVENPDKKNAATDEELTIEIEPDVRVTILKSDLKLNGHIPQDSRRAEYEARVASMSDTVEGHFQIIEFCAKNSLNDLMLAHYLRVLDLDPDNQRARAGVKHDSSSTSRWERVEDRMRRMGKSLVKNKWVYPELVVETEQQEQIELRRKALLKELSLRQRELLGNKVAQASAALEKIDDPMLSEIIAEKLVDPRGNAAKLPEGLKLFYIEQLGRLPNRLAVPAIVVHLYDSSSKIRNLCLDVLNKNPVLRADAIDYLTISSATSATAGLLSSDNSRVRLAGAALGSLKATEAIQPLIRALITRHQVRVSPEGDNYNPESFSTGGQKTRLMEFKNEEVRDALAQITGQGRFGFDKAAWVAWYASLNARPVADLRRDP